MSHQGDIARYNNRFPFNFINGTPYLGESFNHGQALLSQPWNAFTPQQHVMPPFQCSIIFLTKKGARSPIIITLTYSTKVISLSGLKCHLNQMRIPDWTALEREGNTDNVLFEIHNFSEGIYYEVNDDTPIKVNAYIRVSWKQAPEPFPAIEGTSQFFDNYDNGASVAAVGPATAINHTESMVTRVTSLFNSLNSWDADAIEVLLNSYDNSRKLKIEHIWKAVRNDLYRKGFTDAIYGPLSCKRKFEELFYTHCYIRKVLNCNEDLMPGAQLFDSLIKKGLCIYCDYRAHDGHSVKSTPKELAALVDSAWTSTENGDGRLQPIVSYSDCTFNESALDALTNAMSQVACHAGGSNNVSIEDNAMISTSMAVDNQTLGNCVIFENLNQLGRRPPQPAKIENPQSIETAQLNAHKPSLVEMSSLADGSKATNVPITYGKLTEKKICAVDTANSSKVENAAASVAAASGSNTELPVDETISFADSAIIQAVNASQPSEQSVLTKDSINGVVNGQANVQSENVKANGSKKAPLAEKIKNIKFEEMTRHQQASLVTVVKNNQNSFIAKKLSPDRIWKDVAESMPDRVTVQWTADVVSSCFDDLIESYRYDYLEGDQYAEKKFAHLKEMDELDLSPFVHSKVLEAIHLLRKSKLGASLAPVAVAAVPVPTLSQVRTISGLSKLKSHISSKSSPMSSSLASLDSPFLLLSENDKLCEIARKPKEVAKADVMAKGIGVQSTPQDTGERKVQLRVSLQSSIRKSVTPIARQLKPEKVDCPLPVYTPSRGSGKQNGDSVSAFGQRVSPSSRRRRTSSKSKSSPSIDGQLRTLKMLNYPDDLSRELLKFLQDHMEAITLEVHDEEKWRFAFKNLDKKFLVVAKNPGEVRAWFDALYEKYLNTIRTSATKKEAQAKWELFETIDNDYWGHLFDADVAELTFELQNKFYDL